MSLQTYLEHNPILLEGWSAFKKKIISTYEGWGDADMNQLDQDLSWVERSDPTSHTKFGEWLWRHMNDLISYGQGNSQTVNTRLNLFDRYQQKHKKDINNLSAREFIDLTDELQKHSAAREMEKDFAGGKGVEKLVSNEDYLILIPKTFEASCKYGAHTKWCITTKDDDSYWNDYKRNNVFLFIIQKNENVWDRTATEAEERFSRHALEEVNYEVDNLRKLAVQIPDNANLDDDLNALMDIQFSVWDSRDGSDNYVAEMMAEYCIEPYWDEIKKAVEEYRKDPDKGDPVLKSISILKNKDIPEEERKEALLDFEACLGSYAAGEEISDLDYFKFKWQGHYDVNFEDFKQAFGNRVKISESFIEEVLKGDFYYDCEIPHGPLHGFLTDNDIDEENLKKIKETLIGLYRENKVYLADDNRVNLEFGRDDVRPEDFNAVETLSDPDNMGIETEAVPDIRYAYMDLESRQVEGKLYKFITETIDDVFMIVHEGSSLITEIPWSDMADIVGLVNYEERDEQLYIDELIAALSEYNESNTAYSIPDSVYYGDGIQTDEDREYFNERLNENL